MSTWIKGPPTEPGDYWIRYHAARGRISVPAKWNGMKAVTFSIEIGAEDIEWHAPLTPPEPPEE